MKEDLMQKTIYNYMLMCGLSQKTLDSGMAQKENTTKTGKQEQGEVHEEVGEKYEKEKDVAYEKHKNVEKEEQLKKNEVDYIIIIIIYLLQLGLHPMAVVLP
jgi:cbb3-type cytochrome oxidase cytochrome c subunit